MRWNLEQLSLFVRIAEGRSFSAVGRDLQRAQSAVSNAIALLEADLGLLLFERSSGRQPRLTTAGVTLLEEARGPFLFHPGAPTEELLKGLVVVELTVRYVRQLRHEDGPLDARMWVSRVRAVDFTVACELRPAGVPTSEKPSVTSSVQLAAFDIDKQWVRRFTSPERAYLRSWLRE